MKAGKGVNQSSPPPNSYLQYEDMVSSSWNRFCYFLDIFYSCFSQHFISASPPPPPLLLFHSASPPWIEKKKLYARRKKLLLILGYTVSVSPFLPFSHSKCYISLTVQKWILIRIINFRIEVTVVCEILSDPKLKILIFSIRNLLWSDIKQPSGKPKSFWWYIYVFFYNFCHAETNSVIKILLWGTSFFL